MLERTVLSVHNPTMSKSRVEQLKAKKAQIDAQLKAAQARERAQKRKDDTRRKIIVGALIQQHAELNPNSDFTRTVLKLIQQHVTTDKDRALFDLPPLTPQDREPAKARKSWMSIAGRKK